MKKLKVIIIMLMACVLIGCANQEEAAMEVAHKYIDAYNNHDMTTMYECYDPDLQAVSEGLTNSVANYFGISNGYEMGLGMGGLFQNAVQEYLEINVAYEFVKVRDSEFSDNTGYIEAEYKTIINLKEYDTTIDADVLLKFNMVKKDDSWYISNVVEEQLTSDEYLQEKAEELVEKVNAKKIEETEQKIEKVKIEGLSEPLVHAKKFSDGKAWVSGAEIEKDWICIDKSGKVLFILEEGMFPYTDFCNGGALVWDGSEYDDQNMMRLINDKGEEIANLDQYEIVLDNIYEGKMLLLNRVDTFEGAWVELGVMNIKGEWEIPLSKDNVFITESGSPLWEEKWLSGASVVYCGSGVLRCGLTLGIEQYYFNLKTGEEFVLDRVVEFSDGYALSGSENGTVLVTDTSGNTKEIVLQDCGEWTNPVNYSDGLFFEECSKQFYDLEGNVKIDLAKYELGDFPYFVNNYALITFANSYFTIIDKQGNFMFEPIKLSQTTPIYEDILGYEKDGQWYYIDMQGNVLFETEYGKMEFSEGYALVSEEGDVYFIDKNGEKLFGNNSENVMEDL